MSQSPSQTPTPTRQRADIQGLRAVAVLVVLAAHAGVPFLDGGFVGVDVFFVISGFLISQLLFREVARTGRVGLGGFYARRARRILPAATLVTVVTVLAAALWWSVVDALEVVTDAWWATLFAANVRFASVGTDYFAQDQSESPLQHYWSLAVEEQFYLVWPLLLLAVCLVARRFRRGAVAAVLLVAGSASFAYGVSLTANDPTAAYFSTPARAWELVAGALAALAAPLASRAPRSVRSAVGATGLAAITLACLAYSPTTPFPGTAALLPVLGAAAILLAGVRPADVADVAPARVLGTAPLRLVGDWSYSLYLWHWPLLVLPATALGSPLPAWGSALAVAASFVLAGLTYRYVETPWRHPRAQRSRHGDAPRRPVARGLVLYPASLAVVAATCLSAAAYGDRQVDGGGEAVTVAEEADAIVATGARVSQDPTVALVQASVVAAREGRAIPSDLDPGLLDLRDDRADVAACDYEAPDAPRELCERGDPDGERTLVVIGSSHGRMWIPAFEEIAARAGYRAYYLVKPLCSAADVSSSRPDVETRRPFTDCDEFRDWALDRIDELQPDLVVVSTTPPGPYTFEGGTREEVDPERPTAVLRGYDRLFDRLERASRRVVLLRDTPGVDEPADQCLTERGADLGTCLSTPDESVEQLTDASVRSARRADVEVVDPRRWLCWQGECPAVIGDYVVYRDQDHLTTSYAATLADDLGRAMGLWAV
jgi:peptidoglycan/LPS O-acetylase OafA/YrhL